MTGRYPPLPPEPPEREVPEHVYSRCGSFAGAQNSHTGEKFQLSVDLLVTDGPLAGCVLKATVYSDGRVYFRGGNQ